MSFEANRYVPFRVLNEDLITKLRSYLDEKKRVEKIWIDFSKQFGGDGMFGESCAYGVCFKDPEKVPAGWIHRQKDPDQMYVPKARSKERNELKSLPDLTENRNFFYSIVGVHGLICENRYFREVGFHFFDYTTPEKATYILLAPIPDDYNGVLKESKYYEKFPFSDIEEISWSEYYRLVEIEAAAGET